MSFIDATILLHQCSVLLTGFPSSLIFCCLVWNCNPCRSQCRLDIGILLILGNHCVWKFTRVSVANTKCLSSLNCRLVLHHCMVWLRSHHNHQSTSLLWQLRNKSKLFRQRTRLPIAHYNKTIQCLIFWNNMLICDLIIRRQWCEPVALCPKTFGYTGECRRTWCADEPW